MLTVVLALVLVLAGVVMALRRLAAPAVASATTRDHSICGTTANEAGYIRLANKREGHYFYWFFESQSAEPSKDPLVVWLTGGPGASSLYALLTENGPCTVEADLSTKTNAYAWNAAANVIWLDQPIGVGFSYGAPEDRDSNGTNVGANLYWFLQGFLDKHPEFVNRPFFLTGESYGGHYVPAAAHYIWEQNNLGKAQAGSNRINLQGIAIGNGWVDPDTQYLYAHAMADNAYNIPLLNASQVAQMQRDSLACVELSRACRVNPLNGSACVDELACAYEMLIVPFLASGRNPYDIRELCDADAAPRCEPDAHLETFLNSKRVREYLNVTKGSGRRAKRWTLVNSDVHTAFIASGDSAQASQLLVADLLGHGVRVLVYAGDADLVCNWQSSDAWTRALAWRGSEGFNAATPRRFLANDVALAGAQAIDAGVVRSFENFAFVRVLNAGHMVPRSQPAVALDMLARFLDSQEL